ncbi:MAG: CAP domain-containing protein [bacterium]
MKNNSKSKNNSNSKSNSKNKKINKIALATSIIALSIGNNGSIAYANNSLCNIISNSPYRDYNLNWLNCDISNNNLNIYGQNNNQNNNQLNQNNNQLNENNNQLNQNNNTNTQIGTNIEQEVVRLVNIERAKYNLPPLLMDKELTEVARLKSQDMNNKKYFSHTSPTYGSPFDMLRSYNITYKSAGENIAKGQRTAEAVVKAWMDSEGHRRNILSNTFTHIGVGFDNYYWTQMFVSR